MLFCPKCSVELEDEDTFCSECGYKLKKKDKEARTTKVISTLDELVKEKTPSRQNRMFSILVVVFLIIIILLLLSAMGVTDAAFKGSGISYLDPCEREFKECNKECGEGLLSGVCKDVCTLSYRQCRN